MGSLNWGESVFSIPRTLNGSTVDNLNKIPPLVTTGKYRIQGGNKPNLYYQFDWEYRAVMNSLPRDYLPAVAFNPNGSILGVREQPPTNIHFDLRWKSVFIVDAADVAETAVTNKNTTKPNKTTQLETQ